jgi:hypothetical protein
MKIKETVEREIAVAACFECGGSDISISDSNYSSFNTGGGKCKACGHESNAGCGCLPTPGELVAIWNAANDPKLLIAAQEAKALSAKSAIAEIKERSKRLLAKKGKPDPQGDLFDGARESDGAYAAAFEALVSIQPLLAQGRSLGVKVELTHAAVEGLKAAAGERADAILANCAVAKKA